MYVDIVISNAFNLNKFFSFLSFIFNVHLVNRYDPSGPRHPVPSAMVAEQY